MKRLIIFKYSDELGYCYHEEELLVTQKEKYAIIDEFIGNNKNNCWKTTADDITIIRKSSGEELWVYAKK